MIDITRANVDYTVEEYFDKLPYEIDNDGDGECLFRIIPVGQSFNFQGKELAEFVRLSIVRLLEAGAVPVLYAQEGELLWKEQTQYGETIEEIANAIVTEWLDNGGRQPEWDDLWFVSRSVAETDSR